MPSRPEIVAAARRYLGTPYHHQGALAGAGCDCLGLIRGVWRDLYGVEPEAPPPYTPDWGETGAAEWLWDAALRHMTPVPLPAMAPGDAVLFRLRAGVVAKHAAILSAPNRMIHAQSNDRVREVTMNTWWLRHAVAAFAFPGAEASR